MVIDQNEDLNELLWFVVKNPTGVDHEFAVAGLFMLLPEEEALSETTLDPGFGGVAPTQHSGADSLQGKGWRDEKDSDFSARISW